MKILLATAGSAQDDAVVKEIATRPFSSKTAVHVISVINNAE